MPRKARVAIPSLVYHVIRVKKSKVDENSDLRRIKAFVQRRIKV